MQMLCKTISRQLHRRLPADLASLTPMSCWFVSEFYKEDTKLMISMDMNYFLILSFKSQCLLPFFSSFECWFHVFKIIWNARFFVVVFFLFLVCLMSIWSKFLLADLCLYEFPAMKCCLCFRQHQSINLVPLWNSK